MLPIRAGWPFRQGLLVVSWAWSGDWLLDRPAPGRWVRLGLLLTCLFSSACGLVRGLSRVEHPRRRVRSPASDLDRSGRNPLPADQNAADLYREAGRRLVGPCRSDTPEFLDRNRGILDLIRRARRGPAAGSCIRKS